MLTQTLTILLLIARALALVPGLRHEEPSLTPTQAFEQAWSAQRHATPDLPASLMLAIAWRESHYHNESKPQAGVMQVHLASRTARLLAQASAEGGYAAGAAAYARIAADCRRWRVKNVTRCSLNYYAEGAAAGKRGWGVKCGKRSKRTRCDRGQDVLARARRIDTYRPRPADLVD